MEYTRILFSALVGSVIGYITNWLAIKMLFKPHYEKRIFGIKVPFTPGLIPKEQKRIASSVADAVAEHLLTSDTMIEAVHNNGMDKKFTTWVEEKVLEIFERNISIGEQIKAAAGEKFQYALIYIKNRISAFVVSFIRKDKFKEEVENLIIKLIKEGLLKDPRVLLESDLYKKIKNTLIKKSKEYKDSEEFKDNIERLIENKLLELENTDKSIGEIIPVGLISTVKVYVYSKNYEIAMAIKGMLKDENIQFTIKKALSEMISSNVNSMVAMFLNPDTIYKKLSPAIEEYLDKEETQREIALLINNTIDKVLKNKVKEITSNLSEESKKRNAKAISEIIVNKVIDNSLISDMITTLENKIMNKETFEELIMEFNINPEEALRVFAGNKIDTIVNSVEVEEKIREYTNAAVDNMSNVTIKELVHGNEEKISKSLSKASEGIFNRFMKNKAPSLIEELDIRKIVEDKINTFDINFTEKLILEIANKELKAITWLGALLGFIMGLFSAVIAAI